jgi:hypothetical protein
MRSTFKCTQCSRQRQSHVTRAVQGCPTPGRMTTIVSLLPQLQCLQRVPLAAWFVKVVFLVSIFEFPVLMCKDCAVPAHRSPSQALGTPSRALGTRACLSYCSRLLLLWRHGAPRDQISGAEEADIWQRGVRMSNLRSRPPFQISGSECWPCRYLGPACLRISVPV